MRANPRPSGPPPARSHPCVALLPPQGLGLLALFVLVSTIGVSSSGRRRGTSEKLHTEELQAYVERRPGSSVDSILAEAAAFGSRGAAGGDGSGSGLADEDTVGDAYTGGLSGAAAAAAVKTGSALGAGSGAGSGGAFSAAQAAAVGGEDPGAH